MSLDKIKQVIKIEDMVNDFNEDYDLIITITRKEDKKGTKLPINALHEVFQIDFLTQLISSVKQMAIIDKEYDLNVNKGDKND